MQEKIFLVRSHKHIWDNSIELTKEEIEEIKEWASFSDFPIRKSILKKLEKI